MPRAQSVLPNETGIEFAVGAQDNIVGGEAPGAGNLIAFNTTAGVEVDGAATVGNTVRGNSIHSNGGFGISNVDGGNTELSPPVITGFGSVSGTACADCIIDVYSDDEDEGRTWEGFTIADGNGDWLFPDHPAGLNATATATDGDGNTSEFSLAEEVPPPPTATPSPVPTETPTPSPTPGPELAQGDNDCDGDTDAVDALKGLQHIAAIPFEQGPDCPDLGAALAAAAPAGEPPEVFGDVDCDGDVDAVDQLKILQFVAAIPFTQDEPCVDVGEAF